MFFFVFDELANEQAVMHYSRHHLTASVTTWLGARICVHQWPNRVNSVQFSYVNLDAPLLKSLLPVLYNVRRTLLTV